ncbi:hypothetical protein JCM11641_006966 [Rhodosporidiobolus odoratus]
MLVPNLGVNLISMTRLMMAGIRFENNRTTLILLYEQRRLVAKLPIGASIAIEASRILSSPVLPLPPLFPNPPKPSDLAVFPASPSSTDACVWHSRTGHINGERLEKLAAGGGQGVAIDGLEKGLSFSSCEPCAAGKITRSPVSKKSIAASRRVERLVADVWGPSPIAGVDGLRYVVGMVDSASRFMWVKGLKAKHEVGAVMESWIKEREQETGEKVIIFQSDHGGEFVGGPLPGFLRARGIKHFKTVPYVSGQNGLIERQWRTLFETVRCWLAESGLPLSFWIHALYSAAHVHNLSPTVSLPNSISPSHTYNATVPDLSHLRAWGCVGHLYVDGLIWGAKVVPRSVCGRFIGYVEGMKGWKFWVPEWKKTVMAWPVNWFEKEYGKVRTESEDREGKGWLEDMLAKADEVDEGRRLPEYGGVKVKAPTHLNEDLIIPTPPTSNPLLLLHLHPPLLPIDLPPPRNRTLLPLLIYLPPSLKILPRQHPRSVAPADRTSLPQKYEFHSTAHPLNHQFPTTNTPHLLPKNLLPNSLSLHFTLIRALGGARHSFPKPKPEKGELAFAVLDPDLDTDPDALKHFPFLLSPEEAAFAVNGEWGNIDHPTIKQAMARPDWAKFRLALEVELAVLYAMKTVVGGMKDGLMDLPAGKKAIPLKWVLVIKRDGEGRIVKYKARLVARGDRQVGGVDYDKTHSSTVRLTTVRLIYALLARHPHWRLLHFDVTSAYLHGILDHEIYIQQPPGFENPDFPRRVFRLQRALYGLKQGGREWQKVFREELEKLGFKRCAADHGLYVREREGKVVMVPTHVDDGLIVGDDDLGGILDEQNQAFEGKVKREDDGLFLGMRVKRKKDGGVAIDQGHYAAAVLERFGLDNLDPVSTPIDYSAPLPSPASKDERVDIPYRELLGALVWLSCCTRPDLAFAVSVASRFSSCPAERHWAVLKRIC